jgi:hypothetical protein
MADGNVTVKHPIVLDANEETKKAILGLLDSKYEECEAEGVLHVSGLHLSWVPPSLPGHWCCIH